MKYSNMQVTKLLIPLAGLGSRFAPSSTIHPKELTHLVDRVVLQYIVEEAVESGIKEVIFIISSNKDSIKKYFSKKHQESYIKKTFSGKLTTNKDLIKLHNLLRKVKFRYITRLSTLGDGHSILLAKSLIKKDEPFAVSMGDLLSFGDEPFLKQLINIFESKNSPVVSVEKVPLEVISKFGVINPKNSKGRLHTVRDIIEKPKQDLAPSRLILTGKYLLTSDFFDILGKLVKSHKVGEVKLAEALKIYSKTSELFAYECIGNIQDTGNKLDFIKATINFGLKNPNFSKPLKKFIKSLKI
jgi:UTP--glucose-1-phosphate uridylyltransferase